MNMSTPFSCGHGNDAPALVLTNLPESQAGTARHKCATCAYSRGRADALSGATVSGGIETCQHGNTAPIEVLAALPDSQAGSGIQRHKCCVCAYREGDGDAIPFRDFTFPDEVSNTEALIEGAGKQVTVNIYERNPLARLRCIEHYGYACSVCGLDFEVAYGPLGKGLIHVHHLQTLASVAKPYEVDPVADLRPVCPNCHAMIHRKTPPYTLDEVRQMLSQQTAIE